MKHLLKSISVSAILLGAASVYADPHPVINELSHKKDDTVTAQRNVNQIVYTVGQSKYRPFRSQAKFSKIESNNNVVISHNRINDRKFGRKS